MYNLRTCYHNLRGLLSSNFAGVFQTANDQEEQDLIEAPPATKKTGAIALAILAFSPFGALGGIVIKGYMFDHLDMADHPASIGMTIFGTAALTCGGCAAKNVYQHVIRAQTRVINRVNEQSIQSADYETSSSTSSSDLNSQGEAIV